MLYADPARTARWNRTKTPGHEADEVVVDRVVLEVGIPI